MLLPSSYKAAPDYRTLKHRNEFLFKLRYTRRSVSAVGGTQQGVWGTEVPSEVQEQIEPPARI